METSNSKAIIYQGLGVLAIFGLILSFIGNFLYPAWLFIIIGIFKIFLVIILTLIEFRQSPALVKPFSFMFYFLGRGIFYIILGFITIGITILSIVGGAVIVVVGLIYIVLHFVNNGGEPEYMSFTRYQRLTSGISHELPTTAATGQNVYPVAHQVPISQQNNVGGSFTAGSQYNNTQTNTTQISSNPVSPMPVHTVHTDASSQEKTEV